MATQNLNLEILTSFGCLCGACHCEVCGKGRKYKVNVRKTELISSVWDRVVEQNPKIKEKGIDPILLWDKEIISADARVISYDLKNNDRILAVVPPSMCCTPDFRKAPKKKREAEPPAPAGFSGPPPSTHDLEDDPLPPQQRIMTEQGMQAAAGDDVGRQNSIENQRTAGNSPQKPNY